MPQLDFFTFPHQYLVATICFCGLYYFNLLFFFERIKYLHLNKIFSLNSSISNWIIILGDFVLILSDLFKLENEIFFIFKKKSKKLNKKLFLKKITAMEELDDEDENKFEINFDTLNVLAIFCFLVFFFFLKNFLTFNAEKLMLVYFLMITGGMFIFLKFFLKNFLQNDLQRILYLITEIEAEGDRALSFLKEYLLKLQDNLVHTQLEFLLLRSLEIQLIRKIKW